MTRHSDFEQSKEFIDYVDEIDTWSIVDINKETMVFLSNEPNNTANILCKSKDQKWSFEDTAVFVRVRIKCIYHFPNQNDSTFNCTTLLRNKSASNDCKESPSVDKECSLPCFCHGYSSVCLNDNAYHRSKYILTSCFRFNPPLISSNF